MKTCSVCNHPKRDTIDKCLVDGDSLRDIESLFDVSRSALQRHKADHLSAALIKSTPPAIIAENVGLADQLRDIHARTVKILEDAEASGDGRTALVAIRECRSNLELLAKIELILTTRAEAKQAHEDRVVKFVTVSPEQHQWKDELRKEVDRIAQQIKAQMDRGEPINLDIMSTIEKTAYVKAMINMSGVIVSLSPNGRNRPTKAADLTDDQLAGIIAKESIVMSPATE